MYNSNNDIMQRVADYQSYFAGQEFQCMKSKDSDRARLGKVFKVARIEPHQNGSLWALLNDGVRIPVDVLNSDYSMISSDNPALDVGSIIAMNERLKGKSELSANLISTLSSGQQAQLANREAEVQKVEEKPVTSTSAIQPEAITLSAGLAISSGPSIGGPIEHIPSSESLSKELFGIFALSPTVIEFSATLDLPKVDLIRMMYEQASDKEAFLQNFSQYILQNLSLPTIKNSMTALLEPKPKKIRVAKN